MAAGVQCGRLRLEDCRQRTAAAANAVDKVWAKASVVVPKNLRWPAFPSLEKPDRVPLGAEGAEIAAVRASPEAAARRTTVAERVATSAVAMAPGSPSNAAQTRTSAASRKKPRRLRADLAWSPGNGKTLEPADGPGATRENADGGSEGGEGGHGPRAIGG